MRDEVLKAILVPPALVAAKPNGETVCLSFIHYAEGVSTLVGKNEDLVGRSHPTHRRGIDDDPPRTGASHVGKVRV